MCPMSCEDLLYFPANFPARNSWTVLDKRTEKSVFIETLAVTILPGSSWALSFSDVQLERLWYILADIPCTLNGTRTKTMRTCASTE